MKKLYITLLSLLCSATSFASANWTLQGKAYDVDTLYHAKVGPGTTMTKLHLSGGSNLNVFYTTTDLTHPNVDIRVVKGQNKLAACATLSTMCGAATKPGVRYFAGVNADFFGNQQPIGNTVVDSEVYYGINNTWVNWFMTEDKKPGFGTLGFNGTATSGTASHAVAGVNVSRDTNCLVVYTSRKGAASGTSTYGYEVQITPAEGDLVFAGVSKFKVICAPANAGNMSIPAGGYVLSGNGTAAAFVQNLAVGDEVTLDLNPSVPGFEGKKIPQMASGQPMILSGGETLETQGALDHLVALNPRTAIGYDATGTKLVMLVVDGRGASVGVVSKVLADIMREVGCTEAMNFDGGGSSELYASDFGVINNPSDGKERAVTNSVWAVAVAPEDNEIAEIAFEQSVTEVPKYGFYRPVIYAFNKYGVLINKNQTEHIKLSCPEGLGEITGDGSVLYSTGSGTHALTAHYGSITATCVVTVGDGMPEFRLSETVVDETEPYKVEVTAATSKQQMPIENIALKWASDNPEVATVDDNGVVTAIKNGVANITGKLADYTGRLKVNVEIPQKRRVAVLSDGYAAGDWTITKSGLKTAEVTPLGENGLAIDYTVSSTRSTYVKLAGSGRLYSHPDSVRIVFRAGESKIKQVKLDLKNPISNTTFTNTYTTNFTQGEDNTLLIPVSDYIDASDFGNYPLEISGLAIYLGDPTNKELRLEIPAIDCVYVRLPENSGVSVVDADCQEEDILTITPAVAAPSENLILGAGEDAEIRIFTLAGTQVGSSRGNMTQAPSLSGLYIVTATADGRTLSGKLVVR